MSQEFIYCPIVKGKLNDIKAMAYVEHRLASQTKPLYELPPFRKTGNSEKELARFVKYLSKMSGPRPCYVDFPLLKPGARIESGESIVDVGFSWLKSAGVNFHPVYGFDRDEASLSSVIQWADRQGGMLLRLEQDDLDFPDETIERILDLQTNGLNFKQLDVMFDHRYIRTEAESLRAASDTCNFVDNLLRFVPVRTIVVAGSSSPMTVSEIGKDSHGEIARQELILWANIITQRFSVRFIFGDYGVIHPDFSDLTPNAHINGKIRYTSGSRLHIYRGHSLKQGDKYDQYHRLAANVKNGPFYLGSKFSYGDRYIFECAEGRAKTGNPGTWVMNDQNHHFTYAVQQIERLQALARPSLSVESLLEQA